MLFGGRTDGFERSAPAVARESSCRCDQRRLKWPLSSNCRLDGVDGRKLVFASPADTVKVKNIQRTGRASLTVIKFDTRRYVTVEGPASFEPWEDTPAHIKRLKDLYLARHELPSVRMRNLPGRCGKKNEG
jgi:hypothetical protein